MVCDGEELYIKKILEKILGYVSKEAECLNNHMSEDKLRRVHLFSN